MVHLELQPLLPAGMDTQTLHFQIGTVLEHVEFKNMVQLLLMLGVE